jgi:hypothetical protein
LLLSLSSCASEDLVEASVRPINNVGFEMNQKTIDRIVGLEDKKVL